MTIEELDPLSADLVGLLRKGCPGAEPPVKARDAVLSVVMAQAAALGTAGLAAAAAKAAAPGPSGAHAARAVRLWAALKESFGLGGILLGVAIGAAGHAAVVSSTRAGSAQPAATPTSAAAAPQSAPTASAPEPAWTVVPSAPPPAPPAAPRTDDSRGDRGKDAALASERALIDMARTAVARGEGEAALAALGRHEKEFPRGRLAEEREWLAVQALVQTGATDQAKQRAARFREAYPHSLMLAALDQVLAPSAAPSASAPPPH